MEKTVALNYLRKYGKTRLYSSGWGSKGWRVYNYLKENVAKNNYYGCRWTGCHHYYWQQGPDIQKESTFSNLLQVRVEAYKNKFLYIISLDEGDNLDGKYMGPKCEFDILDDALLPEVVETIKQDLLYLAQEQILQEKEDRVRRQIIKRNEKLLKELSATKEKVDA